MRGPCRIPKNSPPHTAGTPCRAVFPLPPMTLPPEDHAPAAEPKSAHWIGRTAFPVVSLSMFATQAALGFAVYRQLWWLAAPLVALCCHLMHGVLIGFHEASHFKLRRSRLLNEIDGHLIAIFSLMSFTLYRAAHQTHHAHFATERDEELWPFVMTEQPRWLRVTAAVLELTLGIIATPLLFLRSFLRRGSPVRNPRTRRRIWTELAVTAAVWVVMLAAVQIFGVWEYFLWLFLVPAAIAANLQSWRKYVEHVGLTGPTVRSATRSIVAADPVGRLVSFTLLHEPYHGVHHLRAGLSHAELPRYSADLMPEHPDEHAPFASYRHALGHLMRELADPRVGAQWRR